MKFTLSELHFHDVEKKFTRKKKGHIHAAALKLGGEAPKCSGLIFERALRWREFELQSTARKVRLT